MKDPGLGGPYDLVVRAGRAVLPGGEGPAVVAVRDGRIAAVDALDLRADSASRPGPTATHVVELAADEVLLPGLVDTHVHVNEPGRTEWEGFLTATRASLAGGVTTIVDMPLNSRPPTVNVRSLDEKRRAADGQCHVDVGFWGGAVPDNTSDVAALHAAGVLGVKGFLADSGVPEFPPLSPSDLEEHLRVVADLDTVMLVHAEDRARLAEAPSASGRAYADFLASHPPDAETAAVAVLLEAAGRTGARVHVVHLSSADALPLLGRARADGVRVTVETCPHYLTFTAGAVPDGATAYKCCPPIRDAANRERLWQALADGAVDAVVSDHSPSPPGLKDLDGGDFGRAWGGIASLQLGLPAVWTEARRRGHRLGDLVRWMAAGPALLAGLPGKGGVVVGADADLVAFAPDEAFRVDPSLLHHRHAVTPYAGIELTGVVRRVWLRGRPVTGEAPSGRLLTRGER